MPTPDEPVSRFFMSQRLRLHCLDWGNRDAPTLILIHGGRDHARSWDWTARMLRDQWHVVCVDLRGHGDSAHSPDGAYLPPYFVHDLAQLVAELGKESVSIVAHSFGGSIALRYAAVFPEKVRKVVAIEGLGLSPRTIAERDRHPPAERWRRWSETLGPLLARSPRRYASIEQAMTRMRSENPHLSEEQALHLTTHGLVADDDGGLRWKFDNLVRSDAPFQPSDGEQHALWNAIACPTLLIYGRDSWASNPQEDGRAAHFRHARILLFDRAGHWVHHDRFDAFIAELRAFL